MQFLSKNPSKTFRRRDLLRLATLAPLLPAFSACGGSADKGIVGSVLPEFTLPDLAGNLTSSRGFPGKAMLINVWATWCHPCRIEMAGLDRLYGDLSSQGLVLLGISVDDDINLVREFVRNSSVSFPVLSDPKGYQTRGIIGSSAVPASLLVGRDGRVRRVVIGERAWDAGEARAWVSELLN